MYSTRSNLVIGFHGCDKDDQLKLLQNPDFFKKSQEDYDWLGHGMYFWENNKERALLWAKDKQKAGTLKIPAVIGAVIDLGYCFDLLDSSNIMKFGNYTSIFHKFVEKYNDQEIYSS